MRRRSLLVLPVALLCAACSFSGIGEPAPDPAPDQTDMRAAYTAIRTAYASFKLSGNPEISSVHRVRGSYLAEWSVCVRNDDAAKRQHYTFYFKNKKIAEWRMSVLVDGCEGEAYTPLPQGSSPKDS